MINRYVIQLIELENGKRSEPFTVTKETYKAVMDAVLNSENPQEKYGVLVVLEYDEKNEMFVSIAPVMNLNRFETAINSRNENNE